jgi:hypothetical protein
LKTKRENKNKENLKKSFKMTNEIFGLKVFIEIDEGHLNIF